jgi:hypothetical protein
LSARLGVDCGHSVAPVNRLTDEQRREVLRVADSLGVIAAPTTKVEVKAAR